MAYKVSNSHITLNVKSYESFFISAFSGYLTFGEIELLNYTKKSVYLPISRYVDFFEELTKVVKFFGFECTSDNQESCFLCLPKPLNGRNWKGKIKQTTTGFDKSIAFFNCDILVFTSNDDQFIVFLETILKVVLFSFVFKEVEILFFQTLIENKSIFTDLNFANEEKLEDFLTIFCSLHQYNKFILKQLYLSYKMEFKFLFQFNLLFVKTDQVQISTIN